MPYPVDVFEVLTESGGLATRCVKVTRAPSAPVKVLMTVTRGGAVKEMAPLTELVTGIELGTDSVVSGELVIVLNTVDVLDGRTETTDSH